MMIDTHFHLNDDRYNDLDKNQIIKQANDAGIEIMLNVCADPKEMEVVIEQANKYNNVYASVGVHPHYANDVNEELINKMEKLAKDKKVIAIGECGLDYFYDERCSNQVQHDAFIMHLELAKKLNLPVIIHSRDAHDDTLAILKNYPTVTKIMHCYSYSRELMNEFVKLGCYISFAGPVTFKNATSLKEAATNCPLDRLLCETDAPWLTPNPHRGQLNYPEYVKFVYDEISLLKGIDIKQVVRENFKRIFNI